MRVTTLWGRFAGHVIIRSSERRWTDTWFKCCLVYKQTTKLLALNRIRGIPNFNQDQMSRTARISCLTKQTSVKMNDTRCWRNNRIPGLSVYAIYICAPAYRQKFTPVRMHDRSWPKLCNNRKCLRCCHKLLQIITWLLISSFPVWFGMQCFRHIWTAAARGFCDRAGQLKVKKNG